MNIIPDPTQDLSEIRSMMERSSKFLSLSGWSGILAGLYAFLGAGLSYFMFGFNPIVLNYSHDGLSAISLIAFITVLVALISATYFNKRKADQNNEQIWNSTSRRLLLNMAIPLVTASILIVVLVSKDLLGLVLPLMLVFYGLSLIMASNFTLGEVRFLGFAQLILGLVSAVYIEYSLVSWVLGFGVAHIIYGTYMYLTYER